MQKLNARTTGDLVWARDHGDRRDPGNASCLRLLGPGLENFWAGTGVMAHNTYGTRMRPHDGRAIPTFMRQALQNRPITVFGDGSQTRSFCYVDDLIRGMIALAESGQQGPINVGNPNEFTLLQLAHEVIDVTGSTSEIVFEALPDRRPAGAPARHLAGARCCSAGSPRSSCAKACAHARGVGRRRPRRPRGRLIRTLDTTPRKGSPSSAGAATEHLQSSGVRAGDADHGEATGRPTRAAAETPTPDFALSERDVRRKRPPRPAFLLRLDTLRSVVRVGTLLMLDSIGVYMAILTALWLKAGLADRRLAPRARRPPRPTSCSTSPAC